MADSAAIADFRRLINEPDASVYTDEVLSTRIDAAGGDLESLASTIWREKAAGFSTLIDVQEGNSNRKLSQLHTQALKMADSFGGSTGSIAASGRRSRTRQIERQ